MNNEIVESKVWLSIIFLCGGALLFYQAACGDNTYVSTAGQPGGGTAGNQIDATLPMYMYAFILLISGIYLIYCDFTKQVVTYKRLGDVAAAVFGLSFLVPLIGIFLWSTFFHKEPNLQGECNKLVVELEHYCLEYKTMKEFNKLPKKMQFMIRQELDNTVNLRIPEIKVMTKTNLDEKEIEIVLGKAILHSQYNDILIGLKCNQMKVLFVK